MHVERKMQRIMSFAILFNELTNNIVWRHGTNNCCLCSTDKFSGCFGCLRTEIKIWPLFDDALSLHNSYPKKLCVRFLDPQSQLWGFWQLGVFFACFHSLLMSGKSDQFGENCLYLDSNDLKVMWNLWRYFWYFFSKLFDVGEKDLFSPLLPLKALSLSLFVI